MGEILNAPLLPKVGDWIVLHSWNYSAIGPVISITAKQMKCAESGSRRERTVALSSVLLSGPEAAMSALVHKLNSMRGDFQRRRQQMAEQQRTAINAVIAEAVAALTPSETR